MSLLHTTKSATVMAQQTQRNNHGATLLHKIVYHNVANSSITFQHQRVDNITGQSM
jgi:hypothetical protein